MTQAPERLVVHLDGQRAVSVPIAAERLGVSTDTMRKTIARLVAAGAIEPLDKGLDERTPLYPYDDLMRALENRPGKGANLRDRTAARPLAELEDGPQWMAYEAALTAMAGYEWSGDAKERAAREIVAHLWGTDNPSIPEIAGSAAVREPTVHSFVASLRAQGAHVTPIPIDRAVEAVARSILQHRPATWIPPHNR